MNTKPKEAYYFGGKHCNHVSLMVAGTPVQLAEQRNYQPDRDKMGFPIERDCPVRGCTRRSITSKE